jgi:thiosulfate/3-mercaptopyruvate sulfurtransferase
LTTLINPGQLEKSLGSAQPPALLDVRYRLGGPPGIGDYLAGHIPGAAFTDLDRDLSGEPGAAGRHPLPEREAFEAAMRRVGVRAASPVVIYDAADSTAAARAWWLLRYFGHPEVSVLDGGYAAWTAAGLPVETGEHTPPPGDFTAVPGHAPMLDAGAAVSIARTGLLLDARAAARYRGEVEPVDAKAGHIPGAVSAPTADNVNDDGTFKSPAQLAERFAKLGAGMPRTVGVYCGSGVTAAHEVLALEVAGLPDAALYVGSWSNWIADPERPVATGNS